MTEAEQRIREALAAGPTPGPWRVVQQKGCCADEIVTDHPDWQEKPNGNFVAEVSLAAGHEKHGQRFEQTAAFIAACDPENIAAILAIIDKLRELQSTALEDGRALEKGAYRNEINRLTALLADRDEREAALTRSANYWKAEHLAGNAEIDRLRAEVEQLREWQRQMVEKAAAQTLDGYRELGARAAAAENERDALHAALTFYANGEHFVLSDANAWDTVSDEPQNWWCDEAGTATVEDGEFARAVLAAQDHPK